MTTLGTPRAIPHSAFAADDGIADPTVVAALTAHGTGDGGAADVLNALANSRLLVPVVAVLDELDETAADEVPLTAEKSSHMATVSTTGRDGRRGMLAFTSIEAMRRWDAEARPVPVATRSAAEAALADGAEALVIDLAGPVVFAVDAPDLRTLASGWRTLGPWPGAETADGPSPEPSSATTQAPRSALPAPPAVRRIVRRARRVVSRRRGR